MYGANSNRKRRTTRLGDRTLHILWRAFGLLPLRYSRRSSFSVLIVPSLWVAVFLFIDSSVSYTILTCSPEVSVGVRCLYELHNFLSHFSSVTIFCKCIFTQFRKIEGVYDFVMRIKKKRCATARHARMWYLALWVLFALQVLMATSHLYTTWRQKRLACRGVGSVVRLLLNLTIVVILSQFVYMMDGIDQAFREMKQHVAKRILTPLSDRATTGMPILLAETSRVPTVFSRIPSLSTVCSHYSTLLLMFLMLQAHFGIVIAIDVGSTFFALLFAVNNLLQIYLEYAKTLEITDIGKHFMMRNISIVIYSLLRIVLVIEVCNTVIMRAKGIRLILKMEGKEVPPISFSAAGYFTVDRRLLVSVISVTITYAIILWQLNFK